MPVTRSSTVARDGAGVDFSRIRSLFAQDFHLDVSMHVTRLPSQSCPATEHHDSTLGARASAHKHLATTSSWFGTKSDTLSRNLSTTSAPTAIGLRNQVPLRPGRTAAIRSSSHGRHALTTQIAETMRKLPLPQRSSLTLTSSSRESRHLGHLCMALALASASSCCPLRCQMFPIEAAWTRRQTALISCARSSHSIMPVCDGTCPFQGNRSN